jgi:Acetyltransferase (GNAT) domain
MGVYQIDPQNDPRWLKYLESDDRASVFHSPGWLEALRRTYGYEPVVFTTSHPDEPLANGVVFSRVNSRLTGRRLVSLPFSDHCEPLLNTPQEFEEILPALAGELRQRGLKYVELRPIHSQLEAKWGASESSDYCIHKVDLRPTIEELFQGLHKSSVRRYITRTKSEKLTYEKGANPDLLTKFYRLFVMTRRRHGLPPSPFAWFSNLMDCLGDKLQIRIVSSETTPVAGILSLTCKNAVMYKYGGSDGRYNNLGGMPYLFWMLMSEAKAEGLQELDLGRSDLTNGGLITFKDRLGGTKSPLTYWRFSRKAARSSGNAWATRIAKRMFALASDPVRMQLGNLLYKHLG